MNQREGSAKDGPSVSLGDIAREAGYSRATVSRALHDSPLLPPATRGNIHRVALRLGYRPDPEVARLLSRVRSRKGSAYRATLGYLNSHKPPCAQLADEYGRRLIEGARERAHNLGYAMDELDRHSPGMTGRRMRQIVVSRGIPGVLLPPGPSPRLDPNLDWSGIAVVAATPIDKRHAIDRILPDNHANMRMVTEQIMALGYRRLGLVVLEETEMRQEYAPSSVFAWYTRISGQLPWIPPFAWKWQEPEAQAGRLRRWLTRHRVEVVLGFSPAVLDLLRGVAGLRLPQDLGFVSYGFAGAGCSRLDERPEAIGAAGVDLLASKILHAEAGLPTGPRTVLLPGCFVPDSTTSSRKGASLCSLRS